MASEEVTRLSALHHSQRDLWMCWDAHLAGVTVKGCQVDKWGKDPWPKVARGHGYWYLGHFCCLPVLCTDFSFATVDKLSYFFEPWCPSLQTENVSAFKKDVSVAECCRNEDLCRHRKAPHISYGDDLANTFVLKPYKSIALQVTDK